MNVDFITIKIYYLILFSYLTSLSETCTDLSKEDSKLVREIVLSQSKPGFPIF